MATNYIVLDSTCFFSQQRLLSCINNPTDDVLVMLCHANDHVWFKNQIQEFSIGMHKLYPQLGTPSVRDLVSLKSPVARVILKEEEKVYKTIGYLKEQGLLKVIDFDGLYEPLEPLRRCFGDAELLDFVESDELIRAVYFDTKPCDIIDRFAYKVEERMIEVSVRNLKIKALSLPRDKQEELKTVNADLDAVAYGIANKIPYKSYNEKIEDGTLARLIGHNKVDLLSYVMEFPSDISENDLTEYLCDPDGYIQSKSKSNTKLVCKLAVSGTNTALNFVPGIGQIKAGIEGVQDLVKIYNEHKKMEELALIQNMGRMNKAAKTVIDCFNEYRMNPIKHTRDM
ncbi:hypothetical protein [Desulfovibrio sp. Fe33]|uniref:hypothetical protein n=1 Tax=Desulfovibrio sp. Fe33 TaxID=3020842 RepID=UPI00234C2EF9|nr:hypothetical protein [Desulfovibrio sp. Fe33]